jgi:hypothetical protein
MSSIAPESGSDLSGLSTGALVAISVAGFVVAVVFFIAYIQIIRRAGYSGWWILVWFVPILNVVMLLIFAYKEWPIQRELRELRGWADQIGRGNPGQQSYPQPGFRQQGYGQDPKQ